jgi:adenylosuccinate synthase
MPDMSVDGIVGVQRGDEAKGRFADMDAENYDYVARFNGGDNAGHTVVLPDGEEFKLHLVPCGITRPDVVNIIGNGTLINPVELDKELLSLGKKGIDISPQFIKVSSGAHLIMPHHVSIDQVREEGSGAQGSTRTGISPTSAEKAMREGIRVEIINNDPDELLRLVLKGLRGQRAARKKAGLDTIDEKAVSEKYMECALSIGSYVTDTVIFLNKELKKGKRVLAEAAQGFLLDIDHGMYPYTSSSSTTSGGIATGLGISPKYIDHVLGVAKAVPSHVGGGPFITEIRDPRLAKKVHGNMRARDAEKGTRTGRKRRLGYLDLVQIQRANMVNGTDEMALTKLDWVSRYGNEIPICVAYTRKGKVLPIAPDSARKLEQSLPAYVSLPNWTEDVKDIREFKDLPIKAQNYVKFVEDILETPINRIGVGQQRDQVIVRN